jgi:ketosteroid isomerase-like protein
MSDVTTHRDPAIQELLDRQAIRDVILRYCRGVDRRDLALVNSVFHPDAIDDHASRTLSGEGLGREILRWVEPFTMTAHHITNQTFHIDGDTAGCESYYTAWLIEDCDGRERPWHTVGRYVDRLERRDGEWRIARRVVVMEAARYLEPGEVPEGARLGLARHDESDPSYGVLGSY